LEEIIKERNKFASVHLFAKAKLRESSENTQANQTPNGKETAILCSCLADMITALSVTTDIKAELGQIWGRLMRTIFQSWDDSSTVLLVSAAHEPFLPSETFKKIICSCYQRHAYHDIANKVRIRKFHFGISAVCEPIHLQLTQDLAQTNIRLKQTTVFLRHEQKMCKMPR
jgi:hypothetical protein